MTTRDENPNERNDLPQSFLSDQAWREIASAPTDGTLILFWNGYRRALAWYARYSDGSDCWHRQNMCGEPFGPRDIDPDTHWMPLPLPPQSGAGSPEDEKKAPR